MEWNVQGSRITICNLLLYHYAEKWFCTCNGFCNNCEMIRKLFLRKHLMKKISFWLVCMLFIGTLSAQQLPHYTQYVLNQYILNPAITGIENYTDVKFSHRHQWVGIEGSPVTSYFTLHTSLGKKDYR